MKKRKKQLKRISNDVIEWEILPFLELLIFNVKNKKNNCKFFYGYFFNIRKIILVWVNIQFNSIDWKIKKFPIPYQTKRLSFFQCNFLEMETIFWKRIAIVKQKLRFDHCAVSPVLFEVEYPSLKILELFENYGLHGFIDENWKSMKNLESLTSIKSFKYFLYQSDFVSFELPKLKTLNIDFFVVSNWLEFVGGNTTLNWRSHFSKNSYQFKEIILHIDKYNNLLTKFIIFFIEHVKSLEKIHLILGVDLTIQKVQKYCEKQIYPHVKEKHIIHLSY
jgi:hypothetical protein